MTELVKFILSTAGLVMILNISKLFKPLREVISKWDAEANQKRSINAMLENMADEAFPGWVKKAIDSKVHKNKKNHLAWFLNSIFTCSLCMGVWAGMAMYFIRFVPYHEFIEYACIGSCCSLILVTFYQFLEKK
jgi:hypothetical protein